MKKTKSALLMSCISLLLCCAMLMGTTMAWFTDTATSSNNRIQAGNLDVDFLMADSYNGNYQSIGAQSGDIFDTAYNANSSNKTLWEPGATHVAYLAVQNNGSLALKYNVYLDITDNGLASALEYAIVPFGKNEPTSAITSWSDATGRTGVSKGTVSSGRKLAAEGGCLDEISNGTTKETDYFALVVHMKEEAGNEYQGKDIVIDVNIVATQVSAELDTFNDDYDENATYPTLAPFIDTVVKASVTAEGSEVTINTEVDSKIIATSVIPKASSENYNVQIVKSISTSDQSTEKNDYPLAANSELTQVIKTTSVSDNSVTYDISFVYTEENKSYDVSEFKEIVTNTIQLTAGLSEVKVTHSHGSTTTTMTKADSETAKEDGKYFYNETTGVLTIWSKTYSDFTVSYKSVFVASIGSTGYGTLAEAFAAANSGDTIVLLKDIDIKDTIILDKTVTINGGGKKFKVSGADLIGDLQKLAFKVTADNVTFDNVALIMESGDSYHGTAILVDASNFTFKDGSIIGAFDNSKYTATNGFNTCVGILLENSKSNAVINNNTIIGCEYPVQVCAYSAPISITNNNVEHSIYFACDVDHPVVSGNVKSSSATASEKESEVRIVLRGSAIKDDLAASLVSSGLPIYKTSSCGSYSTGDYTLYFKDVFNGGSGTENDPFIISNKDQMQYITRFYGGFCYYKIADGIKEIDCTGWAPVYLHGSFDGNGINFTNVTACLFQNVGYELKNEEITLKNFSATMNVSAPQNYGAAALIKNIFNSGTTTFENVNIHGTIEGYWNIGSYYNYGTANYDDKGCDYTVNFVNCKSDATLICTSGNTCGGFLGHGYEGAGNVQTLNIDSNSTYTGTIYTTSGNGGHWIAMNSTGSLVFNGISRCIESFTNYDNNVKITAVAPIKGENEYTVAAAEGVSKILVTVTAQLDAYENNNATKIQNLSGITMTLSSKTITDGLTGNVSVLGKVDSVTIVNNASAYGSSLNDGVLTLNVAQEGANYRTGTARLTVTQYDKDGNILCCGTTDLYTIK